MPSCLLALALTVGAGESGTVTSAQLAGHLLAPNEQVPKSYGAGFSLYAAAWPMTEEYQGHSFQSGLFGTWMFAQQEPGAPKAFYADVEGGLGWWTDTRFPTVYPKFIMGGVALGFSHIANGPSHGAGTWAKPRGVYGVAQLSPWVVFPIDGLNLAQGTCGGLFGYGYLPLPLAKAKDTTDGVKAPTGDNCWTLFLNTANFKGPLAFFLPNFWSSRGAKNEAIVGRTLDARPTDPNRALQLETASLPALVGTDAKGGQWARIGPLRFPRDADGVSILAHRVVSYDRSALYNATKAWLDGGPAASGAIDPRGEVVHTFKGGGDSYYRFILPNAKRDEQYRTAWREYCSPYAPDPHTFAYKWDFTWMAKTDTPDGPLATMPEYYHLVDKQWQPVRPADVPAETGLAQRDFHTPRERRQPAYTTPDDPESCWRKPGPQAGPFKVKLGDGSTLTYAWYRFCDQPALLNADLTDQERAEMQAKVEQLHRAWTKDRDYLTPPDRGTLASLDPAQLVTPPPGLEVGYVPIATRQGLE